jgi:hypothetical protein
MLLLPLGHLRKVSKEKMAHPEWKLLKRWGTPDRINTAAIYMLSLPLGYLWMEFIEKMDHAEWNLLKS